MSNDLLDSNYISSKKDIVRNHCFRLKKSKLVITVNYLVNHFSVTLHVIPVQSKSRSSSSVWWKQTHGYKNTGNVKLPRAVG